MKDQINTFSSEERAVFYQKLYEAEREKVAEFERLIGKFVAWFLSMIEKASQDFKVTDDQIKKEFEALSKALRSKAN